MQRAVSLILMNEEPIAHAEKHLPRNLCPLIKSSYGYAITGTCPYFFHSDLVVGETTCDGKKKMFEYLSRITPVHVMRLPHANRQAGRLLEAGDRRSCISRNALKKILESEITEKNLRTQLQKKMKSAGFSGNFMNSQRLDPPP